MKKPEVTSKRIASIAGKILRRLEGCRGLQITAEEEYCHSAEDGVPLRNICTIKELKALAASALTQAPDKPKKKR